MGQKILLEEVSKKPDKWFIKDDFEKLLSKNSIRVGMKRLSDFDLVESKTIQVRKNNVVYNMRGIKLKC